MILWVFKSCIVFLIAFAIAVLLRRRSPAARHLVWASAFLAVAALPLFEGRVQGPQIPVRAEIIRFVEPSAKPVLAETPEFPEAASSPAKAVVEPQTRFDAGTALVCLYFLGLAYFLVITARAGLVVRRALVASEKFEGGDDRVRTSSQIPVPVTFGWRRPVILLPQQASTWSCDRVRAVLAHETAHIQRGDWAWQTLALVVTIVQWFNPLAWVAFHLLRSEAEGAADDSVLRSGIAASAYAEELLSLVKVRKAVGVLAVPMARKEGIAARVRAILASDRDRNAPTRRAMRATMFAAVSGVLLLGCIGVQEVASTIGQQRDNSSEWDDGEYAHKTDTSTWFALTDGSVIRFEGTQSREEDRPLRAWHSTGNAISRFQELRPLSAGKGRKVREILLQGPTKHELELKLPRDAEILEIVRREKQGFYVVRASFPKSKLTTSLRARIKGGTSERFSTYTPTVDRTDGDLVWLSIPLSKFQPFTDFRGRRQDGTHVIPSGIRRDDRTHLAFPKSHLSDGLKIDIFVESKDWYEIDGIMLEPAPTPVSRFRLADGRVLRFVAIEDRKDGQVPRSWGMDGNAVKMPARKWEESSAKGGQVTRRVTVEITGPKGMPIDGFIWNPVPPAMNGNYGSIDEFAGPQDKFWQTQLIFLPESLKKFDIAIGVPGPWTSLGVEGMGGPHLKATPYSGQPTYFNGKPMISITVSSFAGTNVSEVKFDAFDQNGEPIRNGGVSSRGGSSGLIASYIPKPDQKITRIKFYRRTHEWHTFKNLPAEPK